MTSYECEDPPCLHVVVDYPRKRLAVFLETSDGDIIYVPLGKLVEACRVTGELTRRRFREATGDEIDELAEQYLGAVKLEE